MTAFVDAQPRMMELRDMIRGLIDVQLRFIELRDGLLLVNTYSKSVQHFVKVFYVVGYQPT